jgi:hypothetical protein
MPEPRRIFWPFDIRSPRPDRESARAKTHIADVLWMGVLAQEEGTELRIAGHLMACELCRELWAAEHQRVS